MELPLCMSQAEALRHPATVKPTRAGSSYLVLSPDKNEQGQGSCLCFPGRDVSQQNESFVLVLQKVETTQ